MHNRIPFSLALAVWLGACGAATTLAPDDRSSESSIAVPLPTTLNSTPVLAHAPLVDTARVAGVAPYVAVIGLLNQTAPCFGLRSEASRRGTHVTVRLVATQVAGVCATLAAGAFDYDVGVTSLSPGFYDVDVLHRVVFNDGRVVETTVGARRVEVR